MDLGWWIAVLASLPLLLTPRTFAAEGFHIKECQMQETKVCPSESNGSVCQGSNKSFNLTQNEEKLTFLCKYDPQIREWRLVSVRHNPHGDETGVYLKNPAFIVTNATKALEGNYRSVSQMSGECLGQLNLSVDLPPTDVTPTSNVSLWPGSTASPSGSKNPAPIADITPTSNANMSTTSPASPSGNNTGIIIGIVGTIIGIIGIGIIIIYIKCFKKKSSPRGYAAASQSASTAESEFVMNGFGPHHPQRSQLVSESNV